MPVRAMQVQGGVGVLFVKFFERPDVLNKCFSAWVAFVHGNHRNDEFIIGYFQGDMVIEFFARQGTIHRVDSLRVHAHRDVVRRQADLLAFGERKLAVHDPVKRYADARLNCFWHGFGVHREPGDPAGIRKHGRLYHPGINIGQENVGSGSIGVIRGHIQPIRVEADGENEHPIQVERMALQTVKGSHTLLVSKRFQAFNEQAGLHAITRGCPSCIR